MPNKLDVTRIVVRRSAEPGRRIRANHSRDTPTRRHRALRFTAWRNSDGHCLQVAGAALGLGLGSPWLFLQHDPAGAKYEQCVHVDRYDGNRHDERDQLRPDSVQRRLRRHPERFRQLRGLRHCLHGGHGVFRGNVRMRRRTESMQWCLCQHGDRRVQLRRLWDGLCGDASLFRRYLCMPHGAFELRRAMRRRSVRRGQLWRLRDGLRFWPGVRLWSLFVPGRVEQLHWQLSRYQRKCRQLRRMRDHLPDRTGLFARRVRG